MNYFLKNRLTGLLLVWVVLFSSSAFSSYIQFGDEIPWPLSKQRVITVEKSQGLWKMRSGRNRTRLFNVEMSKDPESGNQWIRVSELDKRTYRVLSWGEGLFIEQPLNSPKSSFSKIAIEAGPAHKDRYGRYIQMFPNGDVSEPPYLLRLVEVETALGRVLGLSLINMRKLDSTHMLGIRIRKSPMTCVEVARSKGLQCFWDRD